MDQSIQSLQDVDTAEMQEVVESIQSSDGAEVESGVKQLAVTIIPINYPSGRTIMSDLAEDQVNNFIQIMGKIYSDIGVSLASGMVQNKTDIIYLADQQELIQIIKDGSGSVHLVINSVVLVGLSTVISTEQPSTDVKSED